MAPGWFRIALHNSLSYPLVTWHQGGPGGSSIDVGLYTEMGFFQLSSDGSYTNDFAWNKVCSESNINPQHKQPVP
jgi:carboxypeptidase C (cathepsin A)